MGSPLGPLMATVFKCYLEEKLTRGDHFRRDHLRFGIICGPIWGSFPVWGSFAVGDHLRRCTDGFMLQLYKSYVDDTLARMPSADVATEFLSTLNGLHPSVTYDGASCG